MKRSFFATGFLLFFGGAVWSLPAQSAGVIAPEQIPLLAAANGTSTPAAPAPARAKPASRKPGGKRPAAEPADPTARPLSDEEIEAWRKAFDSWDAFLTFVVKEAAGTTGDPELRYMLLDILLDARHDILRALGPLKPGEPDPVRRLFLKTWNRLAPVMRQLSETAPEQDAMRLLAMASAGDALKAMDEMGASMGMEFSAEGLRRMARVFVPEQVSDPLRHEEAVDPELRGIFGFGPPLPPTQEPEVKPPPVIPPGGWLDILIKPARAAIFPSSVSAWRLQEWAPTRQEAPQYVPLVKSLLQDTAETQTRAAGLDPRHHEMFRHALLATAWQETCWQHYKRKAGKVKVIASSRGAVGMMQVLPRVWRGFYDVNSLRNDVGYNVRAGSEILMHYLKDFALRRAGKQPKPDYLASITYAMYNGGPAHASRVGRSDTAASLRAIDRSFYRKYTTFKNGREPAITACLPQR
jgi:soluble lytic murein transglycosylase-like protein